MASPSSSSASSICAGMSDSVLKMEAEFSDCISSSSLGGGEGKGAWHWHPPQKSVPFSRPRKIPMYTHTQGFSQAPL